MRIALLAGTALFAAACGEKPATDGASTPPETASTGTTSTPATPPPAPGAKAVDAAAFAKYVPWNKAHPDVKTPASNSGMQYVVLASGPASGKTPGPQTDVEIFYEGRLNATGAKFDSAFDRGESSTFNAGGVVPGFSEALQLMRPGDRWLVYIPAALGYGAQSRGPDLPANSDLVFEIDMVAVH
jgi:FKBP-type peptidyl-prolyl cis-trans isomerase